MSVSGALYTLGGLTVTVHHVIPAATVFGRIEDIIQSGVRNMAEAVQRINCGRAVGCVHYAIVSAKR